MDGNGQSGGLLLSNHFARRNPVTSISAASTATMMPPIGVHTKNADEIATAIRTSSIRSRTLPGTATTTCRLSSTVEKAPGRAIKTKSVGMVAIHVPASSAAAHGPATYAAISAANRDAPDATVSRGLSNFCVSFFGFTYGKLPVSTLRDQRDADTPGAKTRPCALRSFCISARSPGTRSR